MVAIISSLISCLILSRFDLFCLVSSEIYNYLNKLHNKGSIDGEFEAWLTFLGCDEPQYIIKLIEGYPYFKDL